MTIHVRYFAAAKSALGRPEDHLPGARPIAALLTDALAQTSDPSPDASTVLTRCSYLVNGAATPDPTTVLPTTGTLDVLPPFAGG